MFERIRKALDGRIRSLPIVTLMVFAFGVVVLATIFVSSMVFYYNAENISVKAIRDSNQKLLTEAVAQVDNLNDVITALSFYATSDITLQKLLDEFPAERTLSIPYQYLIRSHLTQLWLIRPEIVGISVYTDKIEEVNSQTVAVSSTRFAREMGWLDELGERRGVIISKGETYRRGSTGIPFSMLSLIKVIDDRGEILGYLSFEIAEKYLYEQALEKNKASSSSVLFMIDREGRIIAHENRTLLGDSAKAVYSFLEGFENHPAKRQSIRVEGKKHLVIESGRNRLGWKAVEMIPIDEVYLSRSSILASVMTAGFFVLLVSILLMWIVSVWISRPIVRLSQIMSGESILKVSRKERYGEEPNEIGTLYRSYYRMIERINGLIDELKFSMNTMRRAEINALQAQINPHFMYNTLDYISWVAQDSNVPDISRMLTHLSRFMRASLSESCPVCELGREIEHVDSYLEIFKLRYNNRFSYSIEADRELSTYLVPKFILQPLAENAIIHGFDRKIDGAKIEIRIEKNETHLLFDVYDNGKGMRVEKLEETLRCEREGKHGSYGLKNVEERISFLCGAQFSGIGLRQRELGTCVHFEIPLRTDPGEFEERG